MGRWLELCLVGPVHEVIIGGVSILWPSFAGSQCYWVGRWLGGSDRLTFVVHCQATIQSLLHLYLGVGIAKAL